ncbi:MAG: hypothetical protein K0S11_253 [Gammaproteobacteria bacterium]|jgi:hypothetical protein|nr:hypothetical protein [Gammaproteobacteria bacterium]
MPILNHAIQSKSYQSFEAKPPFDNISTIKFNPKVFEKDQALRSGAVIINAGVIALFKHEPHLFKRYASLFLEITEEDRIKTTPVLLTKLINKLYFEENNLQLKAYVLRKLRDLELSWELYVNYMQANWSDDASINIKHTKHATNDLATLLINKGYEKKRKQLFAAGQEAMQLVGRNVLYTEYEQEGKIFFQRLKPLNLITDKQFKKLELKYPYLQDLALEDRRNILSRTPPCLKKGHGLANLCEDIRGEVLADNTIKTHARTIHHASFSAQDFKHEKARLAATRENIEQWLYLVARQYLAEQPDLPAKMDGCYHIPVATCSLLSALHPTANWFDPNQQLRQIREIKTIVEKINATPLTIKISENGEVLTKKCQFTINLQVYGTNLVRVLKAKEIDQLNHKNFVATKLKKASATTEENSIEPIDLGSFTSFCDRVNYALAISETEIKKIINVSTDQLKDHLDPYKHQPDQHLYVYYLTIRWLYQNYQFTAEQNYHFHALFACINEHLGIPYSLWCNESRDRTVCAKILQEAYLQHKAIYGYVPCLLDKHDRQRVKQLQLTIHEQSLWPIFTSINTPGVTGPRVYKYNNRFYKWLLNVITPYKGNLDNGTAHLAENGIGLASSKALSKNWYQEPLALKNIVKKPKTFWKALWYKLKGNPTPYLASAKVEQDKLITLQTQPNIAYAVKPNTLPVELKELLGIADSARQIQEIPYAIFIKLRELKLIDGIKNGEFIIYPNTMVRLKKELFFKQSLLTLNTQLKQNIAIDFADRAMIRDLVLDKSFRSEYADLFALDMTHNHKVLFANFITRCEEKYNQPNLKAVCKPKSAETYSVRVAQVPILGLS